MWKEVQEVVCCARAASSHGPNGIPYHVYKKVPDVLKYLCKLMVIVWKKGTIQRMCHQTGDVSCFIPKEKNAMNIGQFGTISLLNVESEIFFSVVARSLVSYLKADSYKDISVEEAGPYCSTFGSCKCLWIGATQSVVEGV